MGNNKDKYKQYTNKSIDVIELDNWWNLLTYNFVGNLWICGRTVSQQEDGSCHLVDIEKIGDNRFLDGLNPLLYNSKSIYNKNIVQFENPAGLIA